MCILEPYGWVHLVLELDAGVNMCVFCCSSFLGAPLWESPPLCVFDYMSSFVLLSTSALWLEYSTCNVSVMGNLVYFHLGSIRMVGVHHEFLWGINLGWNCLLQDVFTFISTRWRKTAFQSWSYRFWPSTAESFQHFYLDQHVALPNFKMFTFWLLCGGISLWL